MTQYVDRFDEILAQMSALHAKKGADYGGQNDPYANVRASAEFGVAPWIGALIRLNDKITRLKSLLRNGRLENESAQNSIQDIQVYAVIMQILYEEEHAAEPEAEPELNSNVVSWPSVLPFPGVVLKATMDDTAIGLGFDDMKRVYDAKDVADSTFAP